MVLGAPPPATPGPAHPPLRRGVRLRAAPSAPPARRPDPLQPPAPRCVDRADPRRPSRLHHLGAVRGQPGPPRRARANPPPAQAGRALTRRPRPPPGNRLLPAALQPAVVP